VLAKNNQINLRLGGGGILNYFVIHSYKVFYSASASGGTKTLIVWISGGKEIVIHNASRPRRPHLWIRVLVCPCEAFSKQGEYDLGSIGIWSQID
jgi:hypothetical protein